MKIELNGVHGDGSAPPDELFHRPENGGDTELTGGRDEWTLHLYTEDGDKVDEIEFDNFEDAFAEFVSYAHDQEDAQ